MADVFKPIFDFSDYIAERTQDFTGHEWVFAEIDAWLATPDAPRYFIITGEPGIGKTALARRLTQIRQFDATHFCIARQADTIDPLNFVRSISHQLTRIEGFAQSILKEKNVRIDVHISNVREVQGNVIGVQIENLLIDAENAAIAFARAVSSPLRQLYADGFDQQVVILVDALDEAVRQSGAETIVSLLENARGLPEPVRFLLTARPDADALRHFEELKLPYLLLDAGREENLKDIREYVTQRIAASDVLQTRLREQDTAVQAFVEQMTTASKGNFLYLVWLLRSITEGTQQFETLDDLPEGLDGIYREFLRTRTVGENRKDWQNMYRPLLGVLAAAQAPLTVEQVATFSGLNQQDVNDLLLDVQQFLAPGQSEKGLYQLYHQSLPDFFQHKERAKEFWINLTPFHHQIAVAYQGQFVGRWEHCDLYGFRYLMVHLMRSGQYKQAQQLLLTFDWLWHKLNATDVLALLTDYDTVLTSVPKGKFPSWEGAGVGKSLQLVQGALRLAAHILAENNTQLPGQLVGRLCVFDRPDIQQFVEQITHWNADFHWLYPRRLSLTPPGDLEQMTLSGHTGIVNDVAVTSDSTHAVSVSADKTLKVWDLATGTCVRTLEGHNGWVWGVAVMPDGAHAVSASHDWTLKVWDLASGTCVRTLEGHTDLVNGVAVTPDGAYAVSASNDKTLKVWDLSTGGCVRTLEGHTRRVNGVAVMPDGAHAVSASADKTLKMWDLATGACVCTLKGHTDEVWDVTMMPDGAHAVSASWDRTLKVWDLASGTCVRTLKGHTDEVWDVTMMPDGAHAVSASADKMLKVWDLSTGGCVRTLEGHTRRVNSVVVTPDGVHAVSGSTEHTLKVWNVSAALNTDLATGTCARPLEGHSDWVSGAAVTPDGAHAVSASWDRTLKVWDLATGTCVRTLKGHSDWVSGAAVTPDGAHAVSASWDRTLKVWDLATGTCVRTLKGHTDLVNGVAVTPDGAYAVSASHDWTLKVWDLATGTCVRTLKGHTDLVNGVAVTPDGAYAVSASNDKTLKVWDLTTGECVCTLKGHIGGVQGVAMTPGGAYAVSASSDETLKVWDLATGTCVHTLAGHIGGVQGVAVTPGGAHAVSASYDNTLKVWDLATGTCVCTFKGHTGWVWSVAVTPDSAHVVSASYDNTLKVWDLATGAVLAMFHADDGALGICVVVPDGKTIVTGGESGRVHFLRLTSGNDVD